MSGRMERYLNEVYKIYYENIEKNIKHLKWEMYCKEKTVAKRNKQCRRLPLAEDIEVGINE